MCDYLTTNSTNKEPLQYFLKISKQCLLGTAYAYKELKSSTASYIYILTKDTMTNMTGNHSFTIVI